MTYFANHAGTRQIVDQRNAPLPVTGGEASSDAFGRLRISQIETLFDSKLTHSKQALFWDEAITDTSGNAASTHVAADSLVTMYVEAEDTIARQTKMRFGYQPGKSQFVLMTGILTSGGTGITGRIGAFDVNNGMFFQVSGTTISVGERKATSDTTVAQSSWNLDPMDGTGPSGVTIDFDKAQIFVIDFEWLGVGRVRYGFGLAGGVVYCHETTHQNSLTAVYSQTPNLPLRYEIASAAGGASVTMKHICAQIGSEGGNQKLGTLRRRSTAGTHINCNATTSLYPIIGLRMSTGAYDATAQIVDVSMINEQSGDFEWGVVVNPSAITGSSGFSWTTSGSVQTTVGSSDITIPSTATFDAEMIGGFVKSANQGGGAATLGQDVVLRPGQTIAGVRDVFYLTCRPLAANADIQATLTWREAE